MKAILKKIELKEFKTKKKKKFNKVEFTCDVKVNDKGDIKTYKGSYNEQFARDYFAFCGVKTKDLVGKEVDVALAKREYESNGETKVINYIKFLNVLNEEKQPIFMKKDKTEIDF